MRGITQASLSAFWSHFPPVPALTHVGPRHKIMAILGMKISMLMMSKIGVRISLANLEKTQYGVYSPHIGSYLGDYTYDND